MAIIRCTGKLQKELKVKLEDVTDQSPDVFDWHANLLRLQRKKFILFTNSRTLYSFLVRWTKMPRMVDFNERFKLGLFRSLKDEGFSEEQIVFMMNGHKQMIIAQTNNRSVLGSMNDISFQAEVITDMSEVPPEAFLDEINRELNQNFLSAIKYNHPASELRKQLNDAGL